MQQRVMIAMALACDPQLLIADELGVASYLCDRIAVRYLGRILETVPVVQSGCIASDPVATPIAGDRLVACFHPLGLQVATT